MFGRLYSLFGRGYCKGAGGIGVEQPWYCWYIFYFFCDSGDVSSVPSGIWSACINYNPTFLCLVIHIYRQLRQTRPTELDVRLSSATKTHQKTPLLQSPNPRAWKGIRRSPVSEPWTPGEAGAEAESIGETDQDMVSESEDETEEAGWEGEEEGW